MKILLAAILLLAATSRGASWYIDNAASGANNGTSWTDAWESPTNIVWASVSPGDTIYVSGGSTTKTYTDGLVAGKDGSSGSPIKWRLGLESGHNGKIIAPAFSFETYQWHDVSFHKSVAFNPAASVWDLAQNTNNIGAQFTRTNNVGGYASGAGGQNNSFRWFEIGPIGTTNNVGDLHGFRFLNLTALTNFVIEYGWIHDIQNDGINHNSTTTNPEHWDALLIRDVLIENTGDDGIQTSCNGITIDRCFLRDHWTNLYNGHPDQIQWAGVSSRYLQITRSILRNKANSLVISENYVTEGGQIGPMLIAGNVFYNTRDWVWNDIQAYGATWAAWRANADTSVITATLEGFYALNNDIYYQLTTPFSIGRAEPDGGTRSVWQLMVTNGAIRNNLQLDSKYNSSALYAFNVQGSGDPDGTTNGIFYYTNSFPATHNIVAGPNRSMTYHGLAAANANAHGMGNATNMPVIGTNTYSFQLATNDTAARDAGFSLVALTNTFPELITDLTGARRGVGGGWDIGALESSTSSIISSGLLIRVTFDDEPATADDGYDDTSGNGNHFLHYGYGNAHSESNRVPAQTNWVHPVTAATETGVRFVRYSDGWDEYDESGDYVGLPYTTARSNIWTMPRATILFWGKYDAAPSGHPGYTNWNAQGNRRFLGAGYGYKGAWTIGLPSDGGPRSAFRVYTNDSAAADSYAYFTDRINTSTPGMIGSSTNMRLYTVTWDTGLCTLYLDGVAIATNQFLDGGIGGGALLTNLTVRGPAGLTSGMLEIGGDTHNGNPWLVQPDGTGDDGDGTFYEDTGQKQVPNHAWAGYATMDDFRLYDRPLSADEILAIYNGTEFDSEEEPEPASPVILRATTVRAGNLRTQ